VKHDRISERLELAARKVALISFAIIGVVELHQSDEIVSLMLPTGSKASCEGSPRKSVNDPALDHHPPLAGASPDRSRQAARA
jgi:hypothetical protein